MRHEQRRPDQLRPIQIQRGFTGAAAGSVLIRAGRTLVLCTASVEEGLPAWMSASERGWVTAEYSMLPGSTTRRKGRDRAGKVDGRTTEIQRLIGRSLRAGVDLTALGPRSIYIDCDVLEADGGTRTLSITGAWIALVEAVKSVRPLLCTGKPVFQTNVAAVSVGVVGGELLLDLDYAEDSTAQVDMNVVMTGAGAFIEVQGTAEGRTFDRAQLNAQLDLAQRGIAELTELQRQALGEDWPL